jgi:protein-S-isoprenylcysteine O-methyltransferase Ste14
MPASAKRPLQMTQASAESCPASATHFGVSLAALACLLGAIAALRHWPADNATRAFILLLAAAVPVGIGDFAILKVHRRASTGLDWSRGLRIDVARALTKLLGLAATLGAIALAYWVFPEYHGSFYDPFFRPLRGYAGLLAAAAVVYVTLVDGLMREPRDAYWQLGRAVLGRFGDARRADLANHARGWLVKAFFLPLMAVYIHDSAARVLDFSLDGATWDNLRLYDFLYDAVFLVDLTFTVVGYSLSLRLADSHLRSAEPTMLGWAVALFCYQPFFSLFERQYVAYRGPGFGRVFADSPTLRAAWAVAIVALIVVYSLTTVTFGWRFSNLTHRGILTNGPYRYTKHPAYLSKNLSWWMTSMPFALAGTPSEALRHSLMLLCINVIYYLRARTEERHLSRDPQYVAYALWMNDHGALRALGRWFPFLRYRPPSADSNLVQKARREAA